MIMDTDKLLKAIRILIKEEIRSNLPKIVKEVVNHEVSRKTKKIESRLRKSIKKELIKEIQTQVEDVNTDIDDDPFTIAERKLQESREQTQTVEQPEPSYSKNKSINEILAETAKSYNPGDLNRGHQVKNGGVPINMSMSNPDAGSTNEDPMDTQEQMLEERTMKFNSSDVHKIGMNQSGEISRAEMAAKMGYGELTCGSRIPAETLEGKPVNTSDPKTQPVMKALNRDYTELVKRFKTR